MISSGEPDFLALASDTHHSTVAFLPVRKDVPSKICLCIVFAMDKL